jgi:type IV secretion system protein VirB7
MNLSKIIVAFCFTILLAGCTTAGPYVTNISSDGANGLNIEKCKVELNVLAPTEN